MASKIKVKWYVADGYIGGDRPHFAEIDPADFAGMNRAEAQKAFDHMMSDEFSERISWEVTDYDAVIDGILKAAQEEEDG